MQRRLRIGSAVVLALSLVATNASAALTSSEKGQIRDFVAAGLPSNAPKIRSLVARTDLGADESAEVLSYALAPVSFDDARRALVTALVFGDASTASRPVVVQAVVKGLLARADGVFQRAGSGVDRDARANEELGRIYAFLGGEIANAGKPTETMHDANIGIPPATYEECAKALRAHLDRHASWLKGAGSVTALAARTRAQAQAAYVDMLPDGLTRFVDAADRLGLQGARRKLLAESHVLLADDGALTDAHVDQVRQLFDHVGGSRLGVEVVRVTDAPTPIRARGLVLYAKAKSPSPFADARSYDPAIGGIAVALADAVASRALQAKPELRALVERDAVAARSASALLGTPSSPSSDAVLGAAIHLLVADADRAIDRAFDRWLDGKKESAALLSDAVGALDEQGATVLKAVQRAPEGYATAFTSGAHAWAYDRSGDDHAVTRVTRDGKPLTRVQLPSTKKEPKPEATKPEAAKPEATKPAATKPEAAKPEATKPEATKPGAPAVKASAAKPAER